ncbi:NlpC/P60 family protein [Streptomyces sp. NPDC085479]|uniref:NlpC/P60 family protein n=1 Tax=Streptomyces sp. NPDC085479 TaxID=3365726 RepID=UPI0037CFD38D
MRRAVEWALAWRGEAGYATRCLAFVEDAYERANGIEMFGGDYAAESADLMHARLNPGRPPRGAFVFYDFVGTMLGEHRNWGHVALAVGGGRVVHAWDVVRVDGHLAVEDLATGPGWTRPSYIGWVPVTRLFEGARPKEWGTDGSAAAEALAAQERRFGAGR